MIVIVKKICNYYNDDQMLLEKEYSELLKTISDKACSE